MPLRLRTALLPLLATALLLHPAAAPAERPLAVRCAATAAPRLRDAASNLSVVRVTTRRAARRDALRRCRAAIAALPLAAGGTVGEALRHDPALADAVDEAVRSAKLASAPRYFSDGGVALEYEARLGGAIGDALAPRREP